MDGLIILLTNDQRSIFGPWGTRWYVNQGQIKGGEPLPHTTICYPLCSCNNINFPLVALIKDYVILALIY